ncbi:MAG: 2-C-methyl-D-erythritol 4-phosphate cytidylyltransferase [Bacteroidia bacterium]|jgi:2-C-methyl-D-erythritol 4-phosphate cytidylyltransferase|nr:2-C-methyl-D-erythritol 4-phosphate cytidylyltransferase [Bacteroidia bacterium]
MEQFAVIVAGGSGTRMGSDIPKQFLLLGHQPVLMHTLRAFAACNCSLIVVLPQNQLHTWDHLCEEHQFTIPHTVIAGGNSRFHSVSNGLSMVPENCLVAIHDGVRPCISASVINQSFETAKRKGNAITTVACKDSLRKVNGAHSQMVDRALYRMVQTPQTFQSNIIKQAYAQTQQGDFTDDASVLEYTGTPIHLIEGDYRNIKITTPEDLAIAALLIQQIT